MGNIVAIILIFIVLSLGERLGMYITGSVPKAFDTFKAILVLLLIASILRACGIV